jgi:hypothetical protein
VLEDLKMPWINETVYPMIKNNISLHELNEIYTPTNDEIAFINKSARGDNQKLCLLVMLKLFQRLGYFTQIKDVPNLIIEHISKSLSIRVININRERYDSSNTKNNHTAAIRKFLNIKPFDKEAKRTAVKVAAEAAKTKDNDADIINVVIDELIHQSYELPAFSTLVRLSRKVRHIIYNSYFRHVYKHISDETRERIDKLFNSSQDDGSTEWNALKEQIGKTTINTLTNTLEVLDNIKAFNIKADVLLTIPDIKLKHFVCEADALDASRMKELDKFKRYTLAVSFISQRCASILDDIGEIFVKLVKARQNKARDKQIEYKLNHSKIACYLITTLQDIMTAYKTEGSKETRLDAIAQALKAHDVQNPDEIIDKCKIHNTYAGDNYFPFAWDV